MENKIIPTVGRIVLYKSPASADGTYPTTDRPAIVVDVHDVSPNHDEILVKLCVFHPFGLQFTEWLKQGEADNNWDWMPFQKDQQARLAPNTPGVESTFVGAAGEGKEEPPAPPAEPAS